MKRDGNKTSDSAVPKRKNDANIALALIDTTWRMFVPTLLFAWLGWWLDSKFDTKPVLYIVGAFVGLFFAVLLVRKQVKMVSRLNEGSENE